MTWTSQLASLHVPANVQLQVVPATVTGAWLSPDIMVFLDLHIGDLVQLDSDDHGTSIIRQVSMILNMADKFQHAVLLSPEDCRLLCCVLSGEQVTVAKSDAPFAIP